MNSFYKLNVKHNFSMQLTNWKTLLYKTEIGNKSISFRQNKAKVGWLIGV